jgi:hypothetical protein
MADSPKNSSKFKIHNEYYQGGVSIDPKLATPNSCYYSQNLDFRTKPSQLSVLPASRKLSNNLPDVIQDIDQDLNGVRWAVGSAGYIYQIGTSNVISTKAQLLENGAAGILYNQVTDQLYIPGQTAVSMFGQVTRGTGEQFRSNQFAQSASQANGCVNLWNASTGFFDGILGVRNNAASINQVGITSSSQVTTYATQTYLLPNVLSEATGNFCFFAPDIEPFHSIDVYINNIGTGNWTLTLHDSLNNTLASVTVNNVNLTPNSYNKFLFTSQIRALVNASQTGTTATYHFHLTSSVASDTATAGTINANDLSSCDFLLYAYRLVQTNNGWHPTALFTGTGYPQLCIGNGQYLSTYNFGNDSNPTNSMWVRHQLFFKTGYEACGLTTNNQYLVIAAERRSTNSSRNAQDGVLYFWDGTTASPNIVIDVPMGSPYGLYTFNNVTYFTCAGSLFAWSGGQTILKVRKIAVQNTDYLGAVDSTIISPNMMTSRYNLLMIGYPSSTTNVNIPYGEYSWGTVELTFPNSFGLSYTQSHGYLYNNTSGVSNLQIGCVQNFVDSMYTSWSYTLGGVTYNGLDVLDNFSTPASTFAWQSLIYDGGVRYKQKKAVRYKINFLAFPSNCTLTAMYSVDRGAWITADVTGNGFNAVTGAVSLTTEMNNLRFHELQWGFQGTCSSSATTPPTITDITMEIDPLVDESDLRTENGN